VQTSDSGYIGAARRTGCERWRPNLEFFLKRTPSYSVESQKITQKYHISRILNRLSPGVDSPF
jgi:hypothetical protein